jgi:hypothetical protein
MTVTGEPAGSSPDVSARKARTEVSSVFRVSTFPDDATKYESGGGGEVSHHGVNYRHLIRETHSQFMTVGRGPLLKGKAQYHGPPCAN